MQLEVGQWSRYLVRDGEGQPSLITYKIVGKQEDAHWIESISESYYQRQVTLMLVALGDRRDPTTMQVRTVKQKLGDDAPTEFPPGMINMMQALWTPLLQGLVINWQDKSQQQATVRAGRFEECFVLESTVRILGMEERSRNWSHPQVPLSGLVRSESLDAGSSLELLEFGLNGAVSEIGI